MRGLFYARQRDYAGARQRILADLEALDAETDDERFLARWQQWRTESVTNLRYTVPMAVGEAPCLS
jgi:hypothetical protein